LRSEGLASPVNLSVAKDLLFDAPEH